MYLKVGWKSHFIYVDYDSEFIDSSLQEQTPFIALILFHLPKQEPKKACKCCQTYNFPVSASLHLIRRP